MDSNFIYCELCNKLCNSDNPPFSINGYYVCPECYDKWLDLMEII
jgi:hypothetical protein